MTTRDWDIFLSGWERLVPPKMFCLDDNSEAVIIFLEKLRERFYSRGRRAGGKPARCYVDFRAIEFISPSAALVLAAEFDRTRAVSRGPVFPIYLQDWNPEVRRVLYDLGFLKLLGSFDPVTTCNDEKPESYQILPFCSGTHTNSPAAAKMRDALKELFVDLNEGQWLACYDCLVEAMTNVITHAYPKQSQKKWANYPMFRRWWMTGSVDTKLNRMTIICFDQGISIPGSLPRSKFGERVRQYLLNVLNAIGFDQLDDGELIDAAMEVSRTATGKIERGLGLAQMQSLIENNIDGHLRILSRRGEYKFDKSSAAASKLNRLHSIGGTLIEWELWCEPRTGERNEQDDSDCR